MGLFLRREYHIGRATSLQWRSLPAISVYALLVTLALESRAGVPSIRNGFIIGAVIGYLGWLGAHFSYYATTEIITYNLLIVDPLNEFFHTGIAGAAIAAVLARIPRISRTRRHVGA
jgi:hypothetical protein